jgi:hypothetical protein
VRHVDIDDVALTGGVAIQVGLAVRRQIGPRESIADLDLVASHLGAVAPTVCGDFLVSHYHVPQPSMPKFMVQLVDPESRVRVDVFPDLVGSLEQADWVTIVGHKLKVLSLESILEHKLETLSKASADKPVDPKHFRDARKLAATCFRETPDIRKECLADEAYSNDLDLVCARCDASASPNFPLASKQEIFGVLGYV